jgi:hypothetical protein
VAFKRYYRYFPGEALFSFDFRLHGGREQQTAWKCEVRGTLTGVSVPIQEDYETLPQSCCSVPSGPAA